MMNHLVWDEFYLVYVYILSIWYRRSYKIFRWKFSPSLRFVFAKYIFSYFAINNLLMLSIQSNGIDFCLIRDIFNTITEQNKKLSFNSYLTFQYIVFVFFFSLFFFLFFLFFFDLLFQFTVQNFKHDSHKMSPTLKAKQLGINHNIAR